MGTNFAPPLGNLLLYYFTRLRQTFFNTFTEKKLSQSFTFSFRYIDEVLLLNNAWFNNNLHLIYPNELEIRDIRKSASYLDLHLDIDHGGMLQLGAILNLQWDASFSSCWRPHCDFEMCHEYLHHHPLFLFHTKLYDKCDDFNFPIVKLPFIGGSIPAAQALDVHILFSRAFNWH